VARVSRSWYRVSHDELLWKALFKRDWNINPKIGIAPGIEELFELIIRYTCIMLNVIEGKLSWFDEYVRLWQHTPILETEVLKGHTHQVLHVSFSHNGKYFATCSKDGYILVVFWTP